MKKLCIFLLAALLLAGCATPSESPVNIPVSLLDDPTGPEATEAVTPLSADALLQSLEYALLQDTSLPALQYVAALQESRVITVTDYTENGNTIEAQLHIQTVDMQAVAQSIATLQLDSSEAYDAAVTAAIATAPTCETQVSATFTGGGKLWSPTLTFELLDACYGGLLSYAQANSEGGQ